MKFFSHCVKLSCALVPRIKDDRSLTRRKNHKNIWLSRKFIHFNLSSIVDAMNFRKWEVFSDSPGIIIFILIHFAGSLSIALQRDISTEDLLRCCFHAFLLDSLLQCGLETVSLVTPCLFALIFHIAVAFNFISRVSSLLSLSLGCNSPFLQSGLTFKSNISVGHFSTTR